MTKYKCLQKCFKDQSFDIYSICNCREDDDKCFEKCTTECSEGEDYDYFGDYSFDPEELLTCQEIYQSCDCVDVEKYPPRKSISDGRAGSLDTDGTAIIPILIPCLAIAVLGGIAFYRRHKSTSQEQI